MFFFNETSTTEIYTYGHTLSLPAALPISVAEIAPVVGEELFDTGVNMGPAVPSLWFQQALNALNNGARLYADIKEDGDIGPATLGAFRAYLKARGAEASEVMMKADRKSTRLNSSH